MYIKMIELVSCKIMGILKILNLIIKQSTLIWNYQMLHSVLGKMKKLPKSTCKLSDIV